ncbi:MAG: hypothetical protein HKN49_02585, partial [Gammaproteobacteria bacterium]|nr:hypothetical protein [Gammaproteobacteria bacterium]
VLHLLDLTTRQTVRLSDNVLAGYQFHPIFDPSGDSVVLDETDAEIVEQKPNRIALSGNGGQQ